MKHLHSKLFKYGGTNFLIHTFEGGSLAYEILSENPSTYYTKTFCGDTFKQCYDLALISVKELYNHKQTDQPLYPN